MVVVWSFNSVGQVGARCFCRGLYGSVFLEFVEMYGITSFRNCAQYVVVLRGDSCVLRTKGDFFEVVGVIVLILHRYLFFSIP